MPGPESPSLYDRIGEDLIRKAIGEFYERAFADTMIGYLFAGTQQEQLTAQQSAFVIALLGGPRRYNGKALTRAHQHLGLRPAHFGRRQVLMRETLTDLALEPELAGAWLKLEDGLKGLVLGTASSCLAHPH